MTQSPSGDFLCPSFHTQGMTRIRDEIDRYRDQCIGCGRCRDACPSYRHGGCDPLAVMEGDYAKVFGCVGCGSCSRVCEHTDPKTVMLAAYSIMLNTPVSQAFLDTGLSRYPDKDAPGAQMVPQWSGDDLYVMPGCVAKCDVPYVVYAAASMMNGLGIEASELPDFTCCMYPIQFGTMEDEERWGYLTKMGETAGGRELVTLCGGCSEIMNRNAVAAEHLIDFLHPRIAELPKISKSLRVSVEPGCTMLHRMAEMEDIIRAVGCEPVGNQPGCCGKGNRNVGSALMGERQEAAAEAEVIVVGCPMCQKQYDLVPGGKPSMHLAELVAWAFGDTESLKVHRIPVPFV